MIYVLTIEDSPRKKLIKKLEESNLEFKIVYGIDGRKKEIPNNKILKNTVKACALGHLKVIKLFFESKEDNCFIFEDDFELNNSDIPFLMGDLKDYFTNKYDLVQLAPIDNIEIGKYIFMGIEVLKYKYLFGLSGYLLSRKGAKKILSNIQNPNYHIDYLIGKYTNFISINKNFSKNIEVKSLTQSTGDKNNLIKNKNLSFILNISCCNYVNLFTIIMIGIFLSSVINKLPSLMLFVGLLLYQILK